MCFFGKYKGFFGVGTRLPLFPFAEIAVGVFFSFFRKRNAQKRFVLGKIKLHDIF